MSTIFDSDSINDPERLFSQHQAALSIIQGKVDNPRLTSFKWLDLGCGKGQIIINLDENLSEDSRNKIDYYPFDIDSTFLNITLKKAESLKLKSVQGKTGDITDFENLYTYDQKFDFISLTNNIHEFSPLFIPQLLFESTIRLNENGVLFIYDMESLSKLELGAITWTCDEIHEILKTFLICLEITEYNPKPGKWRHKSCNAWNIQIQREYLDISDENLLSNKQEIIDKTLEKVSGIMATKIEINTKSLESITKYGPETDEEEEAIIKLLYEFWSLNRMLL